MNALHSEEVQRNDPRRRHRRYAVDGGVLEVSWLDVNGRMQSTRSRVLNISENGIALQLPDEVMPLLELFGTVTRAGGSGTGAALKVVLISAVVAGVTMIGEAMTLADALGLPEDLVKTALTTASPLAGIAGRAFSQDTLYQIHLAAKDVGLATASADLPLYRTVHNILTAYPAAADEDLSHIVKILRTQGPAT